jgi:glutathione synthase/RimK-type ligase-like ATP-grasp enzyme
MKHMKRVMIITSVFKETERLGKARNMVSQLNQDMSDVTFSVSAVQRLVFRVSDNKIGITLDGSELNVLCEVIHLRNTSFFPDYANAIRLYADQFGIELVNRSDAVLPYYGKVSQGFLLAAQGINTPSFISSYSNDTLLGSLRDLNFNFPIVIKHNNGTKGIDNYLVRDLAEATSILASEKQGFLAQQYIANSGELRILRFGDHVNPLIFKKQAQEGTYLNNTSQGGTSTPVDSKDVDPGILHQALRAAQLMVANGSTQIVRYH